VWQKSQIFDEVIPISKIVKLAKNDYALFEGNKRHFNEVPVKSFAFKITTKENGLNQMKNAAGKR